MTQPRPLSLGLINELKASDLPDYYERVHATVVAFEELRERLKELLRKHESERRKAVMYRQALVMTMISTDINGSHCRLCQTRWQRTEQPLHRFDCPLREDV